MNPDQIVASGGIYDIPIDPKAQQELEARIKRDTGGSQAAGAGEKATVESVIELTDTGNAQRLVTLAGGRFKYCNEWKRWLTFDGKVWGHDLEGKARALTKQVAEALIEEGIASESKGDRAVLIGWGQMSASEAKRKSMLALAECEKGIPVNTQDLDADPWALNCANGTLNLKTLTLLPHSKADLLTKLVPTPFDRDAQAPTWERFLEQVIPDADVRSFLQRAVGYSLTGCQAEQVVIFLLGEGANGKTIFLNAVTGAIGDNYAIHVSSELLLKRFQRGHPTELADLFGVRMAVCVETGQQACIDEVLIKSLTGGDKIRARRMREDFWEFTPTHHLWVTTNHRPSVQGNDHAIWRRIVVVPFTVIFEAAEQDHKLGEKLRDEAPGILAWAIRGLGLWHEHGLQIPEAVSQTVSQYRSDMDVIGQFLEDCCNCGNLDTRVGATELYVAYAAWCELHGEEALPQRLFGPEMVRRGFERKKSNGRKVYRGLTFRSGVNVNSAQGPQGLPPGYTLIARAHAPVESDAEASPCGPQDPQLPPAVMVEGLSCEADQDTRDGTPDPVKASPNGVGAETRLVAQLGDGNWVDVDAAGPSTLEPLTSGNCAALDAPRAAPIMPDTWQAPSNPLRAQSIAELLAAPILNVWAPVSGEVKPCYSCHGSRFWRLREGCPWVCARCTPSDRPVDSLQWTEAAGALPHVEPSSPTAADNDVEEIARLPNLVPAVRP